MLLSSINDVRTTVTFDDDLYARLQERARGTGRTLRDVLNETVRLGLQLAQSPPRPPVELATYPMGLRDGLSYDNIGELLEQLDGPSG